MPNIPGNIPNLEQLRAGFPSGFQQLAGQQQSPLTRVVGDAGNIQSSGFKDTDALIQTRTDPALGLINAGTDEAVNLSRQATSAQVDPLQQFAGLDSFNEQSSLLGLLGQDAQQEAFGNIPVSAAQRESDALQQERLLRHASASGDLGSGSTIVGAQQLAGQQQSNAVFRRLAELEPLSAAARGVRSDISSALEAGAARRAQLLSGQGVQQANIRLGAAAPQIESRLQQAELSGLQRIAGANQRGQILGQGAQLLGQYAPQIGSYFQSQQTVPTAQLQTGTTQNYIPEAGTVAIG